MSRWAFAIVGTLLLLGLGYATRPRLVSQSWAVRVFSTDIDHGVVFTCSLVTTRNPFRHDDPRCWWDHGPAATGAMRP